MINLKVGRNILDITDSDLILDNGHCYQIITKTVGYGNKSCNPVISKKLFTELKKCGFVFTSPLLKNKAESNYPHLKNSITYWKFDTELMKKMGY